MIDYSLFTILINDAVTLLNKRIQKKTVDLIYERIKHKFENEDLKRAMEDIIEIDDISYQALIKSLRKYRSIRIEEENMIQKEKEEQLAKEFWKANYAYIKQGICNRECDTCKIIYCDLIAQEARNSIIEILSKQISSEEAHKNLAKKFKGIGFELYTGDEPF